jgi:hypothetical protein
LSCWRVRVKVKRLGWGWLRVVLRLLGARESLLARDWDGLPLVLLVRGGAAHGAAALPRCGARRAGGRAAARVVGVQVAGPGLRLRP